MKAPAEIKELESYTPPLKVNSLVWRRNWKN
jgi:hypothetical protein